MSSIKKIAVIYGGFSNEREVSLKTGANCEMALKKLGYETKLIDLGKDIALFIEEVKSYAPDVIFNALHGKYGEDGCIQGLFNMMQIPYTHSGVLTSSMAMDKEVAKIMFSSLFIPVANAIYGDIKDIKNENIDGKWVLKPVAEGSSVGIQIIDSVNQIDTNSWQYGRAMIEEYIDGREFTVGIMDDKILGMAEILTDRTFYNYDAKYSDGGSRHVPLENVTDEIVSLLEIYSLKAHRLLDCNGISRLDYRFDEKNNRLVLLELNTQPGMTDTSLIPDIAKQNGIEYEEIIGYLVESAKCDMC